MKKIFILLIISLFLLVGCNDTLEDATDKSIKTSIYKENVNQEITYNDTSSEVGAVPKTASVKSSITKYEIKEFNYIPKNNTNIIIKYPQLINVKSSDIQTKINTIIKSEALKLLDTYQSNESNITLNVSYTIKCKSKNLLSIAYIGYGYLEDAAYPINLFYTTNIDLDKIILIEASDIFKVDNNLLKIIKSKGQYVKWDSHLDLSENQNLFDSIKNTYLSESFITDLNLNRTHFYFTNDSIGFSIEISHLYGDHIEFDILYENIINNIKIRPVLE